MIKKTKNKLKWLEFSLFQEFPEFFSGVFYGEDYSLDDNLKKCTDTFSATSFHKPNLLHGNLVKEALNEPLDCDGLVTNKKNSALVVTHADCQAGIFYDPVAKAFATIHSGWRGSVQNIYAKTISLMQERYFSKPENIFVGISPSLGPKNAEFIHYKNELPYSFYPFKREGNFFDFWQISRFQLENCGIHPSHIEIAEMCTLENDLFFSYRRDQTTKRNASVAMLQL